MTRRKSTKAAPVEATADLSNRLEANGQYTYSKMDRVCVCGHTLGAHAAGRSKFTADMAEACKASYPEDQHARIDARVGRTFQHCMADECEPAESDAPCGCECFKPARKRRAKK